MTKNGLQPRTHPRPFSVPSHPTPYICCFVREAACQLIASCPFGWECSFLGRMCFGRKELFLFLHERGSISSPSDKDVTKFLQKVGFNAEDMSIRDCLSRTVLSHLKRRWSAAKRNKKDFLQRYANWLAVEERLPHPVCSRKVSGRPILPFSAKGRRAKLRATADIRGSYSSPELVFSAASAVYGQGRRQASRLLEEAGSPRRGPLLVSRSRNRAEHKPYTNEEALALMVDLNLSRSRYTDLQQSTKKRHCSLFPSYKRAVSAKLLCLPPSDAITVRPDGARVELQQLLNHTSTRLLQLQAEVVSRVTTDRPAELTLHLKWGMDGSSGHSPYKQLGLDEDQQMFITTVVPLQLVTERGEVVWNNSTPSSTRFCRPVSLQYVKETREVTEQELQRMRADIDALQPLVADQQVVRYVLSMTMVDGKVTNVATATSSSQRCSMCGVTPRAVNDIEAVAALPVSNLEFGLSTLHCWIRCFECVLHLSYRLPLRKWQVSI